MLHFELREPIEMGSARWQSGAFPCCYPVDMQVWEGNQLPMRMAQDDMLSDFPGR